MNTERIVTSQDVRRAVLQVQRAGEEQTIKDLEMLEPDLCEYLLEESTNIYWELVKVNSRRDRGEALFKRMKALVLVMILSLQEGHRRLWREEASMTRLIQIDPTLGKPNRGADEPA